MRNWRSIWRSALPPQLLEELQVWIGVLVALGALLMLYATLAAQP